MASNPNAFSDAELTNDSDRSSVVFKDLILILKDILLLETLPSLLTSLLSRQV